MPENNQYNNNSKKSTNTRGYTTSNGRAGIPSALEVSYWDDMLRLAFTPELPENQKTETRRYDYNNSWITCISRDKANLLANAYEETIKDAIKNNVQKSVSIPVAGVNQLVLDTNVVDGVSHPLLKLVKDINPDTLKSDRVISYEFNTNELIVDYNEKEGKFGKRLLLNNELDVFIHDLSSFREASGKAYVHAYRTVERTYKDMVLDNTRKIGEKVGAEISYNSNYRRDGMGYGSIFDKNNNNSEKAPTSSVGSMEELDMALEELPFD